VSLSTATKISRVMGERLGRKHFNVNVRPCLLTENKKLCVFYSCTDTSLNTRWRRPSSGRRQNPRLFRRATMGEYGLFSRLFHSHARDDGRA
jgi:hypothetical protein